MNIESSSGGQASNVQRRTSNIEWEKMIKHRMKGGITSFG